MTLKNCVIPACRKDTKRAGKIIVVEIRKVSRKTLDSSLHSQMATESK